MSLRNAFNRKWLILAVVAAIAGVLALGLKPNDAPRLQLYWFIPDGLRAENVVMKVYDWAEAGELPNFQWMMRHGAYGYSIPVFPGHTTANTATLMTGASPRVHGVSDILMRASGHPITRPAFNGFSSFAKKVAPMWFTLENFGRQVALLSMPGSTPPEISNGIVVRGRWGGWGTEFAPIIFFAGSARECADMDAGFTHCVVLDKPSSWKIKLPASERPAQEALLEGYGAQVFAYVYDSVADNKLNYDRVLLSLDKKTALADIAVGEWSEWTDLPLAALTLPVKFRLIRAGAAGSLRLRFFYDNLNESLVVPSPLNKKIHRVVGPMVDFADEYPPQLVYFPEDKKTFLEEAAMSFAWHRKMVGFLVKNTASQIVMHDLYTPNQMLTSRWWLPYLDPKSAKYGDISESERAVLWGEVKGMYKQVDAVLGEVIANATPETFIVLSSDHGVVPLSQEVLINNWLAKRGFLKVKRNEHGQAVVDWAHTRAVFLQMMQVFISPEGFAKPYSRNSSATSEKLKSEVMQALRELQTSAGVSPFAEILDVAAASKDLGLPEDRIGDLTVAFQAGFSGVEQVSTDGALFKNTLKGGYKQGVLPSEEGMLTPFMIVGPGVKAGFRLPEKIHHQDQYPTIFKLMGLPAPSFVEGRVVTELLK